MRNLFCSTLALLFLGPSLPAPGQEPGSKPAATTASATPRNITIDDYFQIRDVSQPELSPDGQWVAYTVRTKILKEDKNEQRLWMVPTHGGDPIPMTAEGVSSSHPRWNFDGKFLAFLSARNNGKTQVWLLNRLGGEAARLTDTAQGVDDFEWSPDSTRLVLILRDPKPEDLEAAKDKDKPAAAPAKPNATPSAISIAAAPISTFLMFPRNPSPRSLPATTTTPSPLGRPTASLSRSRATAAPLIPTAISTTTFGSSLPTTPTKARTSRALPLISAQIIGPHGLPTANGSPSLARSTSRPSTTPRSISPSLHRTAAKRKFSPWLSIAASTVRVFRLMAASSTSSPKTTARKIFAASRLPAAMSLDPLAAASP